MASTYRKKDIREEMDMLRKEGGKATSGSTPVDKAIERAFAAPVPDVPTAQPASMVTDRKSVV